MKVNYKYSTGRMLESLSKAKCSLLLQNYYYFDYYDNVLKDIGSVTAKKIRTLADIKQVIADTKK